MGLKYFNYKKWIIKQFFENINLPDFFIYESANARHWIDSAVIFSKELIDEERDLENELSSLSTRPIKL